MSTYLRLLYIVFWMHPVQRYCTVLGLGVMAGLGATLYSPTPVTFWLAGWGYFIALVAPALLGGAFWRALSAPRVISLAPKGRMRLLLGVLAVAATIPLLSLGFAALYSLGMPGAGVSSVPGFNWMLVIIHELVVPLAVIATWIVLWLVATFAASRSPLAMLLVLLTGIVTVYLLWRFDLLDPALPRMHLKKIWIIALPVTAWLLFAAWYLLARRIRTPGWLLPGGQSVLSAVALAESATSVTGRRTALERLLVGGSSVLRLMVQWLLVYAVLLFLLTLMALQGESEARAVAHILFAALILLPAIVAAQSVAIVRRARVLWLPSGFSRLELHAFTAHTLLKFALGMAVLFAALLLLLWNTQPWHPVLTVPQVFALCLLPGLFAAASALLRPGGQALYWPLVGLVLWFVAWCPLTGTGWSGWLGLVTSSDPPSWNSTSGMLWNAFATAAIIAQVALARRHWQVEDLPRAATSPAS